MSFFYNMFDVCTDSRALLTRFSCSFLFHFQ
jgi:hypothetical protein